MAVGGYLDAVHLGNAVHGFFAADRPGMDRNDRLDMAKVLLVRWGVTDALKAATDKSVLGLFIHLPLMGMLCEITTSEIEAD